MKFIFSIGLFLLSLQSSAQNNFVLIELFTSQGDETSLLAEEILYRTVAEEKKTNTNVFVLEYHVDYWNRLGWKDPLSKFQFTRRQENYSRVLVEKELYTPEIVINGIKSFSGTKEKTLKEEIKNSFAEQQNTISLEAAKDSLVNDTLYVTYTTEKQDKNAVFRVAITENNILTKVDSGANAKKAFVNNFVVRLLYSVDGVKSSSQIKIPVKGINFNNNTSIVSFIQSKQSMKIVSVKQIQ